MELVSLTVKQPYRLWEHSSCEIIVVVEFDMFSDERAHAALFIWILRWESNIAIICIFFIFLFFQDHCRLVNVTSGDGYCYVVTSMPVSQEAFLSRSWSDINPSGFAILPCFSGQVNHPGGSTVVISLSAKCNDKALKVLPHFLRLLIRIIKVYICKTEILI